MTTKFTPLANVFLKEGPSYPKLEYYESMIKAGYELAQADIQDLSQSLKNVSRRYSWEDKVSDSGIQLTAGPSTVTRTGFLLAACPIPVGPQQMTIAFVLQDDQGRVHMLPAEQVKLVQ